MTEKERVIISTSSTNVLQMRKRMNKRGSDWVSGPAQAGPAEMLGLWASVPAPLADRQGSKEHQLNQQKGAAVGSAC